MATELGKAPSGIAGLDEITKGGLPRGRPTLVSGGAGCGKTMFGMQFLVRGALDHGEPGVFVAFEESEEDLRQNVASVGWDLADLEARGLLRTDHVRIERSFIEETGAYDLEGLFIRLGAAIDEIGATRIVLDTLEVLFSSLQDHGLLRSELQRLFRWLKERGVTAIISAERGDGALTRHGLEEYVSDCVIVLDHRVNEQVSTRRLRVVKYRGSAHGTDETPFTIDEQGFRVMPLGSLRLEHTAPEERVSTGIERLDTMLDGDGYFRGSSVLVTGTPGSGKTTIAASFAEAACERGDKAMLFAFEESPAQITRNLRSVGVDLAPHVESGALRIVATRPTARGMEQHLASIFHEVSDFAPDVVVVDPLSAFSDETLEREAMLTRLIDLLKARSITSLFTGLTATQQDVSDLGISSVIDTWINIAALEYNGERNRGLTIVKARGTGQSNQVREFLISADGVELRDVYLGQGQVLMGTARATREADDRASELRDTQQTAAKRRRADARKAEMEAQIAAMRAEIDALESEISDEDLATSQRDEERSQMARARSADA